MPYEVGVQIPFGVHPQVPQEDAVRGVAAAPVRSIPQAGCVEGESNRRRASAVGSRSHDDRDSAEVCGVVRDWFYQKQECDSPGPGCAGRGRGTLWVSIFCARGYHVSTVGRDETVIRDYIRNQEQEDKRLGKMNLWRQPATVLVAPGLRGRVSDPA
jgi:hypothetical protein